jgi:hypothetical protein
VYNIGSSQRICVRDLADMIVQRVRGDGTAKPHVHVRDRAINDCRYALDCSKIEALGWTAKTSFEQGLEQTIAWYGTGVIEQGHWKSSACEIAVMAGAQVDPPYLDGILGLGCSGCTGRNQPFLLAYDLGCTGRHQLLLYCARFSSCHQSPGQSCSPKGHSKFSDGDALAVPMSRFERTRCSHRGPQFGHACTPNTS